MLSEVDALCALKRPQIFPCQPASLNDRVANFFLISAHSHSSRVGVPQDEPDPSPDRSTFSWGVYEVRQCIMQKAGRESKHVDSLLRRV